MFRRSSQLAASSRMSNTSCCSSGRARSKLSDASSLIAGHIVCWAALRDVEVVAESLPVAGEHAYENAYASAGRIDTDPSMLTDWRPRLDVEKIRFIWSRHAYLDFIAELHLTKAERAVDAAGIHDTCRLKQ